MRVRPAELERARGSLLELVPEGFEEREQEEWVELAAYVDGTRRRALAERFPDVRDESVRRGWEDAWKAFHRPCRVGRLWIGPPWEHPPPGFTALVVDPGQAFGTGAHPTTRLCLELLQETAPSSVLDAGSGSGVLAIAAARLGCPRVVAVDHDPAALAAVRANAEANGVQVEALLGDVLEDPLPCVDVAVANLELRLVEPLAARLEARTLIASGYLAGDRPEPAGWTRRSRGELAGWAADRFQRDA